MGKISTYTVLSTPTLNDKLIGTDVTTNNETKNFLISDLLALGVGGNIGKLLGGGIVVAEWNESGVAKALVASLTNLSVGLQWTLPAYQTTSTFSSASPSDGFSNTNGIITQTTAPADVTYAAGLARLHNGGGFTDWYLPAMWELTLCYNSAAIVNKVLGDVNGFILSSYWSSTEYSSNNAFSFNFFNSATTATGKSNAWYVRAVRIHNI